MIYNSLIKLACHTIQCASVVTETINYYLHNESDIYIYIYINLLFRCIWFTVMSFVNNSVKLYYTAWRNVIMKALCLPFHYSLPFSSYHYRYLSIDVQLEIKYV